MKKGSYGRPVFDDGPYVGIPIEEAQGENWLAEFFLKRARKKDSRARTGDKILERYRARLEDPEDTSVYDEVMSQIQNKQSYRPEIVVSPRDMGRLNAELDRFLKNTYVRNPAYAKDVDAPYLLTWLVKNMTNSDCENPIDHVDRYADFVADKTFENFRTPARLGKIGDAVFYTVNTEEYEAGLETSDLFLFFAENGHETSLLPFIRYGIEKTASGPTAYVYAIQKREVVQDDFNEELKRVYAKANSGVKEHRNIQPSMLCVLATFSGMLSAKGVEDLKVPDFIVRRWGEFWDSHTDESDISIQTNATNKFLFTFQRLDNQFEGIDVVAYPNDIDSFMHLKISPEAYSNNDMLQTFFEFGKQAVLEREEAHGQTEIMDLVSEWQDIGLVEETSSSVEGATITQVDGIKSLVIHDKTSDSFFETPTE